MRRGLAWASFFLVAGLGAHATQPPLTAKDVGLMLRSGYSSGAVIKELASRHFLDTVDQPKETALIQAGATPELIAALKSGAYAVPPEQADAAQEKLATEAKRRAALAEEGRRFNTLYQAQLAEQRASAPPQPVATDHFIHPLIKGDLVSYRNGTFSRFDDEVFEKKKLIALYFSAHWCGPCRKFTPELVAFYNRVVPQHPEFEIVLVSLDKSQFGFETYFRETNMPWPAIDFSKLPTKDAIRKYAGSGIPCLVVLDQTGKVVSDSFAGKEYLGPAKVLSDLDTIFSGVPSAQVTARR